MTHYAIATDLNKCVGCLACSVACKTINNVPIGNFWNKTLRIGPSPKYDGAEMPNIDMYFLTVQCQHCADPECVKVCPTEASHVAEDGTVQIDKSKCIGCQFCAMSCPYGVRYLNEEERVVEKCTLCEQQISQGELPQCVAQCGARARFFGDLDKGIESFEGPGRLLNRSSTYEEVHASRIKITEATNDFTDDQVHHLPNVGNNPSFVYILRDHNWKGAE
jgi:Fe-S-cluster-containing dehydrogenase component